MRNYNRQAGATLLELTLVVGIIAIIAIAAISYYNSTSHSNKVKDEVNNLNALTGAVRNMFNSQGDFAGLSNAAVLKSGAFPDRMRVNGNVNAIKHSWEIGAVDVVPTTTVFVNDSFSITYNSVPERACMDIVPNVFRFYETVTINGAAIANTGDVTANCAVGDANVLVFQTR